MSTARVSLAIVWGLGLARSPAVSREGQGQLAAGGAGAIGPVLGNAGIYEAYTGAGSASLQPAPPPEPMPQPAATVTISRERGFEPAAVTIGPGQAVVWRNDDSRRGKTKESSTRRGETRNSITSG
jgi:hypothetical protein